MVFSGYVKLQLVDEALDRGIEEGMNDYLNSRYDKVEAGQIQAYLDSLKV
jgi:hypothetical protein